jgi:formiminotetrahydrofolate cyclodeaminase
MEGSIWTATLEKFRDDLGAGPMPAAVSASAVAASLGLGLLIKVLGIAAKKHPDLSRLMEGARRESAQLAEAADADIAAFNRYMDAHKEDKEERDAALRQAIEVPMRAARSAAGGLDLCAEASGSVRSLIAADLGAAAILLSAAVSATLLTVDFNLRQLRPEELYYTEVLAERRGLEERARRQAEVVRLSLGK